MMLVHENLELSIFQTASKIGTLRESSDKAVNSSTVFQNILKQCYNFRDRVEQFEFPKLQLIATSQNRLKLTFWRFIHFPTNRYELFYTVLGEEMFKRPELFRINREN